MAEALVAAQNSAMRASRVAVKQLDSGLQQNSRRCSLCSRMSNNADVSSLPVLSNVCVTVSLCVAVVFSDTAQLH